MRSRTLFALSALAVSAVLFAVVWPLQEVTEGARVDNAVFLIPPVSVMLVARGVGCRRKLGYAGLTVVLYFIVDVVAGLLWTAAQSSAWGPGTSVLTVAYGVWVPALPLAMLMFFIGRQPSVLWERADTSADD